MYSGTVGVAGQAANGYASLVILSIAARPQFAAAGLFFHSAELAPFVIAACTVRFNDARRITNQAAIESQRRQHPATSEALNRMRAHAKALGDLSAAEQADYDLLANRRKASGWLV